MADKALHHLRWTARVELETTDLALRGEMTIAIRLAEGRLGVEAALAERAASRLTSLSGGRA